MLQSQRISLVVPTCEEIFYLGEIWRDRAMPARLFAPHLDLVAAAHNKFQFIEMVRAMGLRAPETRLLVSRADLEELGRQTTDLVFKPVWSRFASHTLLRPHYTDLLHVQPTSSSPWVAQSFIDGDEISVYAIAVEGRLKAAAFYRSLYRAGKGAGICFEMVTAPAARGFVETFAEKTGWTGQLSFDLMCDTDGTVWPLECNPRATSGVHFFHQPAAFIAACLGAADEVKPDIEGMQGSRLAMWIYGLPQAFRRKQLGAFFRDLRRMDDIFTWDGDNLSASAQWKAFAEIIGIAFRERISPQQAATRDIEWNGPAQSSMEALRDTSIAE
ncbi:ATP-grasp domain-containing protein [Breoghania sp.]|uniref:ATP-grasp domain-containing protein n=1 Tax=Breoghania sp. TaxID=2065378 RepID=UPI002AAC024B|nr:ATP-grasp domain-containing protein [Breoghania sp.]